MKFWYTSLWILTGSICFAQGKYDVNWCFGVKAGISFIDTAHPVNFPTLCDDDEAAACISDTAGNLLFYIAPDTPFEVGDNFYRIDAIYNRDNQIINNGDSIDEGESLSGAVFLPVPETLDSFYIFYMHRLNGLTNYLYYSLISRDSLGYSVIKKNIPLPTPYLEWGIAAVKQANGNDWWLEVHQTDFDSATNCFYTFSVTKDSIWGPFRQNIGTVHYAEGVFLAQLKFSKNGDWLATALADQNEVDLFNFNRCNGQLENYIQLDSIDPAGNDEIEDCEFSEDGNNIYVSEGGGDVSSKSALYQYNLTDSDINSSKVVLFTTDSAQTTFGDLRRAPDNKMYLAVEYSSYEPYNAYNQFNSYLWVINNPDSAGTACDFQPYGYYLGDTLNDSARVYWGLPNMPNYNLGALSIYQGIGWDTTICNTDSITIGNLPVTNVTYAWLPAKGITNTTLAQQTVKPDTSTWYYVTLTDTTINYSCQSVTDSFFVQVVNCCDSVLLAQCTLSKDTFICTNIDTPTKGAVLLVDTVPGVSYTWQPAAGITNVHAIEQIVDPSQSTWYYVTFFSDSDSSSACNQRKDSVYVEVKKCMVGIDEINLVSQRLNIYPNPAQNIAVVEWQPVDEQLQLSVTDLLGRELSRFKVDGMSGKTEMDISGLENGLYVVRLLSPAGGGVGGGSGKLTVIK